MLKIFLGYFYTNDISQAWRVSEQLETGMVAINDGSVSAVETAFTGIKESGIGIEGSKYGIQEYLNTKTVVFGNI